MGRLDGGCPRSIKHRLRQLRGLQRLNMPAVQERQDLPHNPMEDKAAAERGLVDRGERRRFVESRRVERERITCPSLQARDELLLEFDGLVYRVDVALAGKIGVAGRQRAHLSERDTSLAPLPDGAKRPMATLH